MSKKKIIVFGATGSTGIYLTDYINQNIDKKEYEVIAVGRRKTNYFDKLDIRYYSVDITKREELDKLPKENIYTLIILAGILPARMREEKPQLYIDINIKGTLNILEYYRYNRINRIMYTISVSDLYGYLPNKTEFFADMVPKYKYGTDHTVYAISKTTAAELVKAYAVVNSSKYYFFRLPNIYCYTPDKYEYKDYKERKISYRYIIDQAIRGGDIEMWGNPEAKREVVYIKDFCQIIYRALFAKADSGYYNVGSDCNVPMREQIEGIIEVFCDKNKKSNIIAKPEKRSCIEYHLNIEKTKEQMGYVPKYSYKDYLKDYKKEMNSDRFKGL